jgi:hypothetical protein
MIKILWNQCEVQVESRTAAQALAQQGWTGNKAYEQCSSGGKERTFADGHKEIMCDNHWGRCIGIVDKDGAKHMKPESESVLT